MSAITAGCLSCAVWLRHRRAGAVAAFVLQAAISLATNVFFYGQLSLTSVSPANNHLGLLVMLIPPLGGLIVGLLARYGSAAFAATAFPRPWRRFSFPGAASPPGSPYSSRWRPRVDWLPRSLRRGRADHSDWRRTRLAARPAPSDTAAEAQVLVAAGAAAGMAATFNAPLAAVFLASNSSL